MASVIVHLLLHFSLHICTLLHIDPPPTHTHLLCVNSHTRTHRADALPPCMRTWTWRALMLHSVMSHRNHNQTVCIEDALVCVLCIPSVGLHPHCSSHPTHQFNLNYSPTSHLPLKLRSMAYIFPPWWIARAWMFSWAVNRSIRKGSTNGCALLHWMEGWNGCFSPMSAV